MSTWPIFIISGPTASGKTNLSIQLAQESSRSVVINFDSLLFYKELNIGTAKPSFDEMKGVPHEFISTHSISKPLNAADFVQLATPIIEKHRREEKRIYLVGGSAFYLRALIKGVYKSEPITSEVKETIQIQYENEGIGPIRELLKKSDPQSYHSLHENDHYRIIRAAEYFLSTNQPLSQQKNEFDQRDPYDFSHSTVQPEWELFHYYLNIPKETHWKMIEQRTEEMILKGLIDEVQELLQSQFKGTEKPLQSIGYKETQEYLRGEIRGRDALLERISISTRQLAKSQRTFFNKIKPKRTFNPLTEIDMIKLEHKKILERLGI